MKRIFTLRLSFTLLLWSIALISFSQSDPTAFTAGTVTSTSFQFSWTAGTNNDEAYILRSTTATPPNLIDGAFNIGDPFGSSTLIAKIASPTVTYTDNTLSPGTTYYYKIVGHRASNDHNSPAGATGTITTPLISTSGSIVALPTTYGYVSAEGTFTFTASNLAAATETVTITPPTGFEVSLTSGGTFTNSVTKNAVANAIASTSVYIRVKASSTTTPATYSGNVTLSAPSITTAVTIATTASVVSKKNLTMTGLTLAGSKIYDATTTAVVGGSAALLSPEAIAAGTLGDGKPFSGDVINISGSAIGTYNSKDVATATTVSFSGLSLGGAQAANYTLTIQSPAAATITPKALTLSSAITDNKTFDGTATATLSSASLSGAEAPGSGNTADGLPYTGDGVTVTGSGTGTFANNGPGVGIAVNAISGFTLSSTPAGNYSPTQPTSSTGTIFSIQPLVPSTSMVFSAVTNTTMNVSWTTNGTGSNRILVVKQGSSPTAPVNGTISTNSTTYTANTAIGSVTPGEITAAGSYVVYIGSGGPPTVNLTNFNPNTSYTFNLYEFNTSTSGDENYLTSSILTGTQTTTNEPLNHATALTASATASAITVSWTAASGSPAPTNYLISARNVTAGGSFQAFSDGAAVPTNDVNLTTGNNGTQSVAFGTNTFNGWTTLTPGSLYEFQVNSYTTTGTPTPDYKTSPAAPTVQVYVEPSGSASVPTFSNITPNSIDVTVGGATGIGAAGGYLVIRKATSAPLGTPSDGTVYTNASTIGGDQVVYVGAAGTFTDSGLSALTNYFYDVYAFSGTGAGLTNYKITSPGVANTTTLCAPPATQATAISFGASTASSVVVNITRGSGTNVLLLIKQGTASAVSPTSGTAYTASNSSPFSLGSAIAGYNVAYNGTGGATTSVTVSNLSGNVAYNFKVFEFNSTGNCYLIGSPSSNDFTTPSAGLSSTLTAGTGSATLSSIANTQPTEVTAFTWTSTDLGDDNVSSRLSSLTFRLGTAGMGNDPVFTDFTQFVLGAELYDNHGSGPSEHNTAVITSTGITISGINYGDPNDNADINDLGTIPDGGNKTYTLKLWFKTSLGGSLPTTIDGKHLVLSLSAADITIVSGKSGYAPGATTNSGAANNTFDVTATSIRINQQPSTSATATVALVTQPIFEAIDANNNRDLLNNALTVGTSNGSIGPASAPAAFISGIANFTASGFKFNNTGTTTMNVGITSPTLTSPNSNSITVTATTTLGASTSTMSASPLTNSTTGSITAGVATNAVLKFSLATSGSSLTVSQLVFNSSVSPTNLLSGFKLYSNTTDNFTGAIQEATSSSLTFSALSIPVSSTPKYFFLVCDVDPYFPSANPTINFSIQTSNITVSAGTVTGSTQTGITYTLQDLTPPTVQSVTIVAPPTTNIWSTSNGTSASTLTYRVTFSEPVSGIQYSGGNKNFQVTKTGTVAFSNPTGATTASNFVDITLTGVSGQGLIRVDFTEKDNVVDVAGNPVGGIGIGNGDFTTAFSGNTYYTIALPEPVVEAITINTSNITGNSITLTWTGTATTPVPTHFLVLAKPTTSGSFPILEDVVPAPGSHHYISDGALAQNITYVLGTNTATFNGLNSGTSYDFRVYKYALGANNSNDNIDFETTTPGVKNAVVTTTASLSSVLLNSTPVPISSLKNANNNSVSVMQFTIYDDGLDPISPNVMNFNDNGTAPETVTFTLRDQLTNGVGALLSGFSASSTGAIPNTNAVYSAPATNIITLTSPADGAWNSGTTISYSAATGNVQFATLGMMQSIANHVVSAATPTTVTYTISGGSTFTVPAGVTSVVAEVWGGGGSGGPFLTNYNFGSSSGGGGGAYSRSLLSVTPGTVYTTSVGAGGPGYLGTTAYVIPGNNGSPSYFGSPSTVYAVGGYGGWNSDYTDYYSTAVLGNGSCPTCSFGGAASGGVGDVKYSGGNGGIGYGKGGASHFPPGTYGYGGGGGSSAGTNSNGNPGFNGIACCINTSGGIAPLGGGTGGFGTLGVPGGSGSFPGSGGGGTSGLGPYISGAGADGQVKVTYYLPASSGSSDWAGDNSPFKFKDIVITQGAGNAIADWTTVIAGAELFDGTNSVTTTPSATSITFSNLTPTGNSSDVGVIPDAPNSPIPALSSKTYTLKIWLKNNITNPLASTIDGTNLAFALDLTNPANITYDDATNSIKSSRLTTPAPNLNSGTEQIQVVATELDFSTNPNPSQLVLTSIVAPSAPPDNSTVPVVRARDANNNTDKDFSATIGLTSSAGNSPISVLMTSGVASLSGVQYQDAGDGTFTASTATFNAIGGSVANGISTPTTTVSYSQATTITTANVAPVKVSSLATTGAGTAVFDFTVNDDNGSGNDGAPTLINDIVITKGTGNTVTNWNDAIASASLSIFNSATSTTTTVSATSFNANSITFNNLLSGSPTSTDKGYIIDNKFKTFTLYIVLRSPMATSTEQLDDKRFVFDIDQTLGSPSITLNTKSSKFAPTQKVTSGSTKDLIDVQASQLDFASSPGAIQYYDTPFTPTPSANAHDANGNLDIDYTSGNLNSATVATSTGLTLGSAAVTVSSGLLSFNSSLQVTTTGAATEIDGASTQLKLTGAGAPAVSVGSSSAFTLNYSHKSDIRRDSTFTYPTNILYATVNNQAPSPLTNSNGIALERFFIRDGGLTHSDLDGSPTVLTSITLNVANYQNLRELALFSGSTNLAEVTVSSGSVTFSGFAFSVAKNTDAPLTIKGSFKSNGVTDNQVISFSVVSIQAQNFASSQFATTTPVGIQSSVSSNQNKIEVVATQIIYTTVPTTASINVPISVTVQAQDAFLNLDADYNGASSIPALHLTTGNTSDYSVLNLPSGNFVGGILNYPGAFQFTSGTTLTQLVLDGGAANTSGASVDAGAITGISPAPGIDVKTSFDSWLYFDNSNGSFTPSFTYTKQIDFIPYTNNATSSSSLALAQVILSDGGYPVGTKYLPSGSHNDTDGAFTKISDFTIALTNYNYIKAIALWTPGVGGTKIAEITTVGTLVTFNGLNSYPAADNDAVAFVIRAEFDKSIPIPDQTQITLQITGVTHSGGSDFPAATIGGVSSGDVAYAAASGNNTLNVIATSLDFTTQPSAFAGLAPSPVGLDLLLPTTTGGKVTARDTYGNVDTSLVTDTPASGGIKLTDGNGSAITLPASAGFVGGILDLKGMIYNSSGDGTVRVQTKNSLAVLPIQPALDSKFPINNTGNSKFCSAVQVINTTVQYDASTTPLTASPDATGQANLKGGKTGLSIFGLNFTATGILGNEPKLKNFTIGFKTGSHSSSASAGKNWYYNSNTSVTVFNSATFKIFYNGVDISTKGGSYTTAASTIPGEFDLIKVNLTGFLNLPNSNSLTVPANIVLQVDVSSTTNGATQTLIPYLVDAGFGAASDANILVSNGTAYSIGSKIGTPNAPGGVNEIDGIEYNFASASPPKLLADKNIYPTTLTSPFTPQSNVDPVKLAGTLSTKPKLILQFDTNVGVLDNPVNGLAPTASIYDRTNSQKVADLYLDVSGSQVQATVAANGQTINNNAVYGQVVFNVCNVGQPNQFLSTPLLSDHVYYVNIAQAGYNQLTGIGTGIADVQLNFYGGVSDNSTLYFKTWSNTAPTVSDVSSPFNTTALATIAATFNEAGTAYFLILPHLVSNNATTFTGTQIKNGTAPGRLNTPYGVTINQLGVPKSLAGGSFGPQQTFEFAASISSALDYDVFIYTENNAGTPIGSVVNYYPNLIKGATALDPANNLSLTPTVPLYQICPDSYTTLTQPMVIMESFSFGKNFFQQIDQTVNILLPPGYEFDTNPNPLVPLTISLGPATNDFANITTGAGAGSMTYSTFSSNTTLQIRFNNSGSSNYDVISISGLRVIGKRAPLTGTLPAQGDIYWFYGSDAITTKTPSNIPLKLATIGISIPTTVPDFTNSYWNNTNTISPYYTNYPLIIANSSAAFYMLGNNTTVFGKVNAIPDNFSSQVRLQPISKSFSITEDYLASTFSGAGVSGDLLTLSAVVKNAPFNIVMDHTDVNGCAFVQSEQYIVYDHNSPISTKLGVPTAGHINPATNQSFTLGTVQDIINTNFNTTNASNINSVVGDANSVSPSQTITDIEKAGYSLLELQADLPLSEIALNAASKSSQLISGSNWRTLIKSLPKNQFSGSNSFIKATWEYANILNASTTIVTSTPFTAPNSTLPTTHVYDYFKQSSPFGNYFWQGGSLGNIEFTGLYMNAADNSIFVPFRQNVELFVPAVPIIEIQSPSSPPYDLADAAIAKAPTLNPSQYPSGYKGTAIFCEFGGNISLIAFPQANGGTSVGKFAVYKYAGFNFTSNSGISIATGFVDNNNGTMTIDPTDASIKNNYNDILVTYTYQTNNSPAVGTGYLVIRVAPNPITNFAARSIVNGVNSPNASDPLAICAGNQIDFDATTSTINGTSITSANNLGFTYAWNFSDANSGANASNLSAPSHTFAKSNTYDVKLDIISNYGCNSIPQNIPQGTTIGTKSITLTVGDLPSVDFSFYGNCVTDAAIFVDASSTPGTVTSGKVHKFLWDFDNANPNTQTYTGFDLTISNPPAPFNRPVGATDGRNLNGANGAANVSNIYQTANFYKVKLTTITNLGCSNYKVKSVAQLPVVKPTQSAAFNEYFSTNGGWLTLDISGADPLSIADGGKSSWVWNDPTALGKWTTTSNYTPNEKSALYSACLDLSTIPRPVMSLRSYLDLSAGEGLVVQYSKDQLNIQDKNKAWKTLGTTPDATSSPSPGLFWYNRSGLPSNPGTGYTNSDNAFSYGWTDKLGYTEPKHALEDITSNSSLPNNRVILRFAFSALNAGGKGITIDSVRVGSRTRTILFENFTTADLTPDTDPNSVKNKQLKDEADYITAFTAQQITSTQLVNINYHIGFLGKDPFNALNPADPSSRALYYNISQVPYAFLDGKHSKLGNSDLFQNWGKGAYDLQTLNLANADFNVAGNVTSAVSNNAKGTIEVDVNVTPAKDMKAGTTLYIGVLEASVLKSQLTGTPSVTTGETQFNYVLRTMLPNAIGTKYKSGTFKNGVPVHLGPNGKVNTTDKFVWIADKFYSNNLSVVVFLQDSTKEVYQAELFQNITPPTPVTGIEQLTPESVNLYPNPANQEFTIELPRALRADANVRMIDQVGQTIDAGVLPTGKNTKTISTFGLASGVYIVEILSDEGSIVRKKVIVVH